MMARLADNQFLLASIVGSFPSRNTSGKKYGKNLPSVYFTCGISEIIRSVAPPPTEPTTASNPICSKYGPYGSVPIQLSPKNIMASLPASCTSSTNFLASLATNA